MKIPKSKKYNVVRGILYLLAIWGLLWSVSNIIETENQETIDKLIHDNNVKELQARREREEISRNNFLLHKKFDSLQEDILLQEDYIKAIKKDYSDYLQQFKKIKNEEKQYIPNATLSEQLDVITTAKYTEYK